MACGWLSRAAIRPSRNARWRCSSTWSPFAPAAERTCLTATCRPSSSSRASHTVPMPPPPICDCRRYRPATRRPGAVMGRVTTGGAPGPQRRSDRGGDPVPARVLLLGADGQDVVELPELGVHLGVEIVEE